MKKNNILSIFLAGAATAVICISGFCAAFAAERSDNAKPASSDEATGGDARAEEKDQQDAAAVLAEFNGYFEELYGRTFTGYLYAQDDEHAAESFGYDRTDIPTAHMGSYIYDFDSDGEVELLAIQINTDRTLKLCMYEVNEGGKVYMADSLDSYLDDGTSKQRPVYVVEEGHGFTDVFLYDYNGSRICMDTIGVGMFATGKMRRILSVSYDGKSFVHDMDPYTAAFSALLSDDEVKSTFNRGLKRFGIGDISIEEMRKLIGGNFIKNYLTGVLDIALSEGTAYRYADSEYYEWAESDRAERFDCSSIYFSTREELNKPSTP